jgi:hypothetical protein
VLSFKVIRCDFSVFYPIDAENASIMRKGADRCGNDAEMTFFWKNMAKMYQIINI